MPTKARRLRWLCLPAIAAATLFAWAADIELTTPEGRRVLLKADKTWRYADDAAEEAKTAAKPAEKKLEGEAVLSLEGKIEGNRFCRLQLHLVNNLPYEIRSIVPEFAAYRPNGVVYDALLSGFNFIKPGDSQRREVRFNGIDCKDIARVHVAGADRCEMGDLDKFSPGKGMCLARVRVVASDVLPFEKRPEPEKIEAKAEQPASADVAVAKDQPEAKSERPARPLPGEPKGSRGLK